MLILEMKLVRPAPPKFLLCYSTGEKVVLLGSGFTCYGGLLLTPAISRRSGKISGVVMVNDTTGEF